MRLKRTVTPARLSANHRAALGSTGPRTLRGKQRSSLNALPMGGHSNTINLLWDSYFLPPEGANILGNAAPFGAVRVARLLRVARELMAPVQLAHPDVANLLNLCLAEVKICLAEGEEPIEPDPDRSPGGFLYDLEAKRKNRGGGKNKSKPKTPLKSIRPKNEPTILLMAQDLAN
jgi:hypothetical protein